MKRALGSFLLTFIVCSSFAQLKSPDQFLGYPIGSRYTPHFNIVNYFREAAAAMPSMMKLEQYGRTNEGRPLMLAYIATQENLSRLEEIRKQNLANAGQGTATGGSMPAIVWLSYNVHGNETSSSEAAMLTLFELLNPSNLRTKDWLKNLVVIIDPCINPDGRDRYVNWYNSVVGKVANPNPYTREHLEPWPGGRSNHYYFDLNRDWAWQTQLETRQRMLKYNSWLPHVHVDFHEQSYNEPYYFAPAAEPYHEVITGWQRKFQEIIGKNNAKYFDQNGWLYFTKERFDLFYPSYGDTYPIYKGAIGMTFEQGGGSRSGSAVIIDDGDTLTLHDRMLHHFTTGMSTIEVSAVNASRLVDEYKAYYQKAVSAPGGEFRAYVLKAGEGNQLQKVTELLDRNNISWSYSPARALSGISYRSGKTENFRASEKDVVINANQPNSNLLRVLFERQSKISDSVTYDITAWSVPYVFGVEAFGLNAYVPGLARDSSVRTSAVADLPAAYGYAIGWNGSNGPKFLAAVLNKGITVRFATESFTADGKLFEKGTLVITRAANGRAADSLNVIIARAAAKTGIEVTPVMSGFVEKGNDFGSHNFHVLRAPRIGLLAGDQVSSLGMGEIWNYFDNELEYPLQIIYPNNLDARLLANVDVLIMPDGNYQLFNDKAGSDNLKSWITAGGKLVALENAVGQLAKGDFGFRAKLDDEKPEDPKKDSEYKDLRTYGDRERQSMSDITPGAIYNVELDNTHPLAYGYGKSYYSLRQDVTLYEFMKDGGWNVGIIRKNALVSGFAGVKARQQLKDGMIYGVRELGRGSIVLLGDDPLFRNFWENGKLLFCNAVFLVGQ